MFRNLGYLRCFPPPPWEVCGWVSGSGFLASWSGAPPLKEDKCWVVSSAPVAGGGRRQGGVVVVIRELLGSSIERVGVGRSSPRRPPPPLPRLPPFTTMLVRGSDFFRKNEMLSPSPSSLRLSIWLRLYLSIQYAPPGLLLSTILYIYNFWSPPLVRHSILADPPAAFSLC